MGIEDTLSNDLRSLASSPLVNSAIYHLNRMNVHCLDGLVDILGRAADELDKRS